jgi:hypothetical protein
MKTTNKQWATLSQIKKAFRLYKNAGTDKAIIRHNVRNWLRAMELLGDSHILATFVPRKTPAQKGA